MQRTARAWASPALAMLVAGFSLALSLGGASAAAPPLMTIPGVSNVDATGAATYSIPIGVPPGTAGMVPTLSLDYSSHSGDGIVGWQWSLNGLGMMVRCARTQTQDTVHGGVNYDNNDRFCLDGQRLILTSGTYGADSSQYHTEIETFSKIIAHGVAGNGPQWFEVHTKSGLTLQYGDTTDSRALAVGKTTARAWALNKVTDSKGNYYTVTYTNDATNGQIYPTRIDYTGNAGASVSTYNSVRFTYNTARVDVTPTYRAGSLQKTTVLLTDIKTYAGASVVNDYKLAYRAGTTAIHSRLTSVTLCDASTNCLAPTTFGWQGGTTGLPTMTTTADSLGQGTASALGTIAPGDFTGDGLTDAFVLGGTACNIYAGSAAGTYSAWGQTITFTQWTVEGGIWSGSPYTGPVCYITQPKLAFGDFDGDGVTDLAVNQRHSSTVYYEEVLFNRTELGNFQSIGPNIIADLNGDGRSDFVSKQTSTITWYDEFYSNGDGTFGLGPTPSTTLTLTGGDFDGDGCADLLEQGGTNAIVYACSPAVASAAVSSFSGAQIVVGDFNGDGLSDLLIAYPSAAGTLYLSTGTGLTATTFTVPSDWGKYQIVVGDWNGDGRSDIALVAPGGTGKYGVGTSHSIWLSTGTTFTQQTTISNTNAADTAENAVVADWNNDGASDIWLQRPSGNARYTFAYVPELMTTVSNGVGATTTFTYDRINKNGTFYVKAALTNPPTIQIDGPYYVVKTVTTSNGIGGTLAETFAYAGAFGNTNSYSYSCGNACGRGYLGFGGLTAFGTAGAVLGFAQITATNSQSGIVTTTNYHTDFPYYGRISSQTRTLSGVTLSSAVNTWSSTTINGLSGTHYYFVSLSPSVVSGHDLNGATLPTATTSYTYDTYGNPLTVTASMSDGSSSTTTNTYTNDTTNWLLGQLATKSVHNIVGSSNLTRHFSFGHESASGLLNQVILEPSNSTYKLQTDYTLDAFGHSTTITLSGLGITTRSSSVGYDTLGEFATSSTNALSQGDSTGYSANFGLATSHTDIDGLVSGRSLDTLGRTTLETRSDGTKTSISYAYCSGVNGGTASCPTYGAYLQQSERFASDGTTQISRIEITYFDALGRVIASDSQGFDGSNRRVATQYDTKGRVSQTSRPYFTSGGTAKWTVYTYDALDRVTKAVFPDTSQTTYTFNGLTTSVTNNLSQTTSKTLSAQGLPASVTDAASHVTHYVYDAFNELMSVTDPSGNVITSTYDIRGRKTGSVDPDMGSWIYSYDVLSELTSQTDAKSQITNLTYDLIGRVTERSESGMVSDWIYDGATHGIGRLQAVCTSATSNPTCTSALTTKTFTYDVTGRPSTTTINTDSTNFGYATTYNTTNGAVDTITHPSGLVSKNVYNSYGYLCSITDTAGSPTCTSGGGSSVFFTANTADAELHLLQQTEGNGVVTTDTFDANTGRMTNVRAGPSNAVAQFDYTYDTIGNLTYRSDDYVGVFERYCYDNLNRLTNSATGASGVTTCTSSGTGITTKTIGYDQLGNITSKSDVGIYSYPASGSGSVQPHAVSSISGTVNGVTNPSYTYDLNGNMTIGAGFTATYTSFNMAATITQGTTTLGFTYDSDHQRIKQCVGSSCATSITYYLNDPMTGAMSDQVVAGGTTTWHDFIKVGGRIIAERYAVVGGSTSWSYFVLDHLGSIAVNTDGTGTVVERLSYDAWGRRRNSDGTDNTACSITSATTRGFTGHEEMDSICQVNANARIYDPTLGRFMSADTFAQDPFNGQALNRYSYLANGPLSGTDPTGHAWNEDIHPKCVADCFESDGPPDILATTASQDPWPCWGCIGSCSGNCIGTPWDPGQSVPNLEAPWCGGGVSSGCWTPSQNFPSPPENSNHEVTVIAGHTDWVPPVLDTGDPMGWFNIAGPGSMEAYFRGDGAPAPVQPNSTLNDIRKFLTSPSFTKELRNQGQIMVHAGNEVAATGAAAAVGGVVTAQPEVIGIGLTGISVGEGFANFGGAMIVASDLLAGDQDAAARDAAGAGLGNVLPYNVDTQPIADAASNFFNH